MSYRYLTVVCALIGALLDPGPRTPADRHKPATAITGRVVTSDGGPWGGAVVRAVSRPVPEAIGFGVTDIRQAFADARGRFLMPVLGGRSYSLWAVSRARPRATKIEECVVAGSVISLQEDPAPRARVTLIVTGMRAWKRAGALSCHVFPEARNRHFLSFPIGADGIVRFPVLPGRECVVHVLDRSGRLLAAARHELTGDNGALRPDMRLPLGAPVQLNLRVLTEAGRPVANAHAAVRAFQHWPGESAGYGLGSTDEDGWLRVTVSRAFVDGRYMSWLLEVHRSGYKVAAIRGDSRELRNGRLELVVRLVAAEAFVGRLRRTAGQPLASTQILVTSVHELGREIWPLERVVSTDERGRFSIDDLSGEYLHTLAVLDPSACDGEWAPVLISGTNDVDSPIDLVLSDLASVEIRLRRENGMPVGRAEVLVYSLAGSARSSLGAMPVSYVTDRRGRVEFRAPRGVYHVFALERGRSSCMTSFVVEAKPNQVMQLELRPMTRYRGRVVDRDDRPIAGAYVFGFRSRTVGFHSAVDDWEASVRVGSSGQTDSSGAFELWFPRGAEPAIGVDVERGGETYRSVVCRPKPSRPLCIEVSVPAK